MDTLSSMEECIEQALKKKLQKKKFAKTVIKEYIDKFIELNNKGYSVKAIYAHIGGEDLLGITESTFATYFSNLRRELKGK